MFGDVEIPCLEVTEAAASIRVLVPHLPEGMSERASRSPQRALLDEYWPRPASPRRSGTTRRWRWPSARMCPRRVRVYDCMDELSGFKNAPASLSAHGAAAARPCRPRLHRRHEPLRGQATPPPQRPRLSLAASIATISRKARDRRGTTRRTRRAFRIRASASSASSTSAWICDLVAAAARAAAGLALRDARPGREDRRGDAAAAPEPPLARAEALRRAAAYIGGWDVGFMPFALNEATRFISPTKTPEYLAAGVPVVSTPIRDVVRPYGENGLVASPTSAEELVAQPRRRCMERRPRRVAASASTGISRRCPGTGPGATCSASCAASSPSKAADGPRHGRAAPSRSGCRACLTGSSSAPASPAACWRSGSPASAARGCLIVDKRPHIGGNAYDRYDDDGAAHPPVRPAHLPHQLRRRSSTTCRASRAWRPYEHRVLAEVDGQAAADPDQPRHGQRALRPVAATEDEVEDFFAARAEPRRRRSARPRTSSSARSGRELYEKFFRGYTRKQWGLDPSQLDKSVTARVPVAHQPRRPLFHRHVPGDAAARLHADVREHARPPQHQGHAEHGLSTRSAT